MSFHKPKFNINSLTEQTSEFGSGDFIPFRDTGTGSTLKVDYDDLPTVVLDADDISDSGTTNKWSTAGEKTKLSFITVTQAVDLDTMESDIAGKQATLVSGTNIKTINGSSVLGSGDLTVGVSDGDKGDITVSSSGATWAVDNNAITFAKMQAITDGKLLGASGGTAVEEITIGAGVAMSADTLTGNVATDTIWDAKGDLIAGTGANTAQKLTVGSNGQMIIADSGETTGLKYIDRDIVATGGTISYKKEGSQYYKIHTFTSDGTFTVTDGAGDIEYAVVGGGGGGGYSYGGGGAGGDVETGTQAVETDDAITVVIGAATTRAVADGDDGNQSSFGAVVALGGGGGLFPHGDGGDNSDYTGGVGGVSSSGGGGAGAGENGADAVGSAGGDGGDGENVTLRSDTEYFGGGGGGSGTTGYGQGGLGGGANSGANGVDAAANTGGGGSGSQGGSNRGGAGASGVVIVRYPVATPSTSKIIQKRIFTYTPTTEQLLTLSYAPVTGFTSSDISFTPLSNDSKIKISFTFHQARPATGEAGNIGHYVIYINDVAQTLSGTTYFGATTENTITVSFVADSWGAGELNSIELQAREYNASNEVKLHENLYFDGGTATGNFVQPICEIEEIE